MNTTSSQPPRHTYHPNTTTLPSDHSKPSPKETKSTVGYSSFYTPTFSSTTPSPIHTTGQTNHRTSPNTSDTLFSPPSALIVYKTYSQNTPPSHNKIPTYILQHCLTLLQNPPKNTKSLNTDHKRNLNLKQTRNRDGTTSTNTPSITHDTSNINRTGDRNNHMGIGTAGPSRVFCLEGHKCARHRVNTIE